ncbi:hypothetical protein BU17DRAFT_50145 [Hysterangium stoloniferum]|nr:hypothetical protein BU17DRAFT_50145 [Hysterangium stoloniferum]
MLSSSLSLKSHIVQVVITPSLSRAVALGKRKASEAFASGSHRRVYTSSSGSSSEGEDDEESNYGESDGVEQDVHDYEEEEGKEGKGKKEETVKAKSKGPPGSVTPKERPYRCTYENCSNAYTKPSRLAEHRRSHTGERPFICPTCSKSYLREAHLQAHSRSHLPESERPFICEESGCTKRFWTMQHLNVHMSSIHHGEKPFNCAEDGCEESFTKHNQLRRHIAEVHSPPGTNPFPCTVEGCTKTFATNQKLRKHMKVHEENRYACGDTACAIISPSGASSPIYFSTWTSLQAHLRNKHPPMCPHSECNGRVFASQKGLKGHLKVHEERDMEDSLEYAVGADERPAKRRRGGEVGRDWICEVEGCPKAFKSKKALTTHHNITHLGRRDYACSDCGQTFGYKHLLQRHTAKMHSSSATEAATSSSEDSEGEGAGEPSSIAWITGQSYTYPSTHNNTRRRLVPCPWPNRFDSASEDTGETSERPCAFIFSRAYDLRRHLKADHTLELTKDEVDGWVRDWRSRHT